MKVRALVPSVRALMSAALVVAFMATLSFSAPTPAEAITRDKIIKRSKVWVKHRVRYSQFRTYKGYRRDCSGFVSMAWGLNRSYTTRTISSRAKRIRVSSLKPGDAVLIPGRHVSIFAGWKNKRARTYWALEQTTWGSHAKKRVRTVPRSAKALRYKGITTPKVAKRKPTPSATKPVSSVAQTDVATSTSPPPVNAASIASLTPEAVLAY